MKRKTRLRVCLGIATLLLVSVSAGCGAFGASGAGESGGSAPVILHDSLAPLRDDFNALSELPRVVAILSPT